jgi:hypothetical protein
MKLLRSVKARVEDGRLVLDEPTDLPEGTEVRVEIVAVVRGDAEHGASRFQGMPGEHTVWEWLKALE